MKKHNGSFVALLNVSDKFWTIVSEKAETLTLSHKNFLTSDIKYCEFNILGLI